MSDTPQAPSEGPLELRCPCCSTVLTVDRTTGDILYEQRPKKSEANWDQALKAGAQKKEAAEALFNEGMDREQRGTKENRFAQHGLSHVR